MADETLLVVLLGGLHLIGLGFAALLLLPCLHDDTSASASRTDEDEDGGSGNDRVQPLPPRGPRPGGLPLPDAHSARVRLRDGRRLGEQLPRVARRPAHAPGTPQRTPARGEPN